MIGLIVIKDDAPCSVRREGVWNSGVSTGDLLRSGVGGLVTPCGGVASAGGFGATTLKSTIAWLSNERFVCVAVSIVIVSQPQRERALLSVSHTIKLPQSKTHLAQQEAGGATEAWQRPRP